MVVEHAPHHGARVAANVDILGLWPEGQGIDRQVRFLDPPVGLGRDLGQLDLAGRNQQINPRAGNRRRDAFSPVKDQVAENLLQSDGAKFGIGHDVDIVVTKDDIMPHRAAEMVIVDVAGVDRSGAVK